VKGKPAQPLHPSLIIRRPHVCLHSGHARAVFRLAEALLRRHPRADAGHRRGHRKHELLRTTSGGRYVLTLFEKLTPAELPFYLGLMAHLAQHGVPSPAPTTDLEGRLFSQLNGKPAALISRLPGEAVTAPTPAQCGEVGSTLADMHLAGQSYPGKLDNPRGPRWWREAACKVRPFLDAGGAALLGAELEFQTAYRREGLPRGPSMPTCSGTTCCSKASASAA